MEQANGEKIDNFRIRIIQMLTLIFCIEKNESKGRLLQVQSGEGKSVTIQMVAAYFALEGNEIDIIVRNDELAKKGANDSREFFSRLGLEVEYLSSESKPPNQRECAGNIQMCQKNVTYSTMRGLCLADLRRYMPGTSAQKRKQDFLIMDEVDDMLMDSEEGTTHLSQPSYYEKNMQKLLEDFWKVFIQIWQNWKRSELSVRQLKSTVKTDLIKLMNRLIGAYKIKEFRHLTTRQLDAWIEKAILAQQMQENKQYLIVENEVRLVDHETGELRQSKRCGDILYHFLEKKHGICDPSFDTVLLRESHLAYMGRYGSNLVGLTGTLGSVRCRDFLIDQFNVDTFKIPTFLPNRYRKVVPLMCEDKLNWHKQLLKEVYQNSRKLDRPLLLIFATVKEVEQFREVLVKKKFRSKIFVKLDPKSKPDVVELGSKSIILGTTYSLRGIEFEVSDKLSEKGGLHVVVTFVPANSRVEREAFGQAARKGQRGSGRMILNAQRNPWLSDLVSTKS